MDEDLIAAWRECTLTGFMEALSAHYIRRTGYLGGWVDAG